MNLKNMNDQYVYVCLDTRKQGKFIYDDLIFDYEPFYVGQGKNKRYLTTFKGGSKIKMNKIYEILNDGHEPHLVKVYENLDIKSAINLEIELILKIGRMDLKKGPLVNLSDGGQYKTNTIVSIETRKKQSLAKIGMSPWNKNIPCSNETKQKISNSLKGTKNFNYGKIFNEEHKRKLSESNKTPQIKPVCQYSLKDELLLEYDSILSASILTKINKSSIGKCCRNISKTAGGFKWRFKYENNNHRKC